MIGLARVIIIACGTLTGQPPAVFTTPVDFFREEITIEISDSVAAVLGVYYFRNNTGRDRPFPVIFPFYVDSVTSYPDKINAYTIDGDDTLTINFKPLVERDCVRMAVPMKPKAVTVWYLEYRQRIEAPHARYILTSTAAWKKPLEEATYRFIAPVSYDITSVWPEPDNTEIAGENKIFKSERKNFMPERDMEIIWERQ